MESPGLPSLPASIIRLIAAVNRGDTSAFLAQFTDDAVVDDWGRRFDGVAAIRRWSDKEFIGANGHMVVKKAECAANVVTLDADWRSDSYGGGSRFVFTLAGDRVSAMSIPAR